MKCKSLDELCSDVAAWRQQKRHRSEALPIHLLEQAKLAVKVHGVKEINRLTGIDRKLLKGMQEKCVSISKKASATAVPAFTLIEVTTPHTILPKAEVEAPTGYKLRIFELTPDTIGLLSSFCHVGG